MNSLKAIVSGVLFIIVASLVMQLGFLITVVGYNSLAQDYPFLNEISWVFRYLLGIPIFIVIMFVGGYITGVIAKTKVLLHSLVVGVITIGSTMWMALENSEMTLKGIIISLFLLIAVIAGGVYARRKLQL